MLSASNAVPRTTEPAIMTVAASMPSSLTPAAIRVAAERIAALPHGEARERGHRMVGDAAAGAEQRAGAGGPQDGCGDLCRDDGAEDIDYAVRSRPAAA
jgi:hypothetical protein